ncbi:2-succinyl-6-hydroxy-2,4-cyclohexadiene-1-carboxylate synthase [Rubrobacter radiotolerans]|uniref:Putative 2-succinyl-6-hydroxy-2,4-cyclohexadiene-1-carboxylate synthase n=1 Tax=Rubrobacter radiotolerans TaxID=42256 RepID=A0A023X6I1_RUBRA|nr:2-succinyl-6-hydroxy-2,4-cyclohexadiene-1-carboxylate synthase [Rubrobacter radiotolerans]AHY47595.1 2-succinyl-6-hydroxy-2,4-cyclohexadiene-1-carboxylate synthase [Rubrobacter radiotolerans]MDX5895000.1 2-succinyl-6-hydroxy-2,4-cyclohexadiene-1-carboxylate synthase [Rubrobacter radiotolerans]SMC07247.1 2-succinyl-6-hydroxy-2,4-cyclohexadiene-1-carboxylate synthase [Rubrobacter radiotolerans DSM 5868]
MSATGSFPAVLCLHGFLGSSRDWSDLIARLPDRRFVLPDLPGHGAAVGLAPEEYTMEGAAQRILDALDGAGAGRCLAVGYSMGGRLALYLALRHPERLAGVLLESASPGLRSEGERAARQRSDGALASRLEGGGAEDFAAFLREWHRQPLFASLADHAGLVERLVRERRENDPQELARSLRGMGTGSQPSLWSELPDLRVPALAVVGERDEKFAGIAHEMSRRTGKVRVAVVREAGHNVHLEQPREFAKLLKRFAGEV